MGSLTEVQGGRGRASPTWSLLYTGQERSSPPGMGWLIAATLIALVLRGVELDQNALWIDEYLSLLTARAPMAEMPAAALKEHALNPPLYFWLLHLTLAAFGEGEAAARIPSVVAGVLTIPVIWLLAREVTRSVMVANLSALLLAVHPLHIWYSQEARPYALLLLLITVALYSLAGALRRQGVWWWVGFTVATALALLTHVFAVVVLVVGALWIGFRAANRAMVLRFAGAALAAMALVSPMLIMLVRAAAAAKDRPLTRPPTGLELPYTVYTFVAGYSFGPSVREIQELGGRAAVSGHLFQVSLVAAVLVAFAWVAARRRSAPAPELAVLFLAPLGVALGASLLTAMSYSVRYGLPALIGFIPLVALTLARLSVSARRVGVGAMLGLLLWSDTQWYAVPQYRKEDTRAAVACLSQVLKPGATVLVAPAHMAGIVEYYSERSRAHLRIVGVNEAGDLTRSPRAEALLMTRLHYVHDPAGLGQAFLGAQTEAGRSAGVIGYRVYLAEPARTGPAGVCGSKA